MSTDYDLVCHTHRERVNLCSDGFSGPILQADKTLAFFAITHRLCSLAVISEHDDTVYEYFEWSAENREKSLTYERMAEGAWLARTVEIRPGGNGYVGEVK